MNKRAVCEGRFTLPVGVREAVPLFTPEGERRWAGSDWNPVYPIPAPGGDGGDAGTVFTTASDGGDAIWIVLERRSDGLRYARVAPDRIAGTIEVTCAEATDQGGTEVAVGYNVTSLGPEGVTFVEAIDAGFDEYLESWRREILAGLAGEP
jgi:hypothetical protein